MKFNYCISNPAFNIASEGNIAGTGGNTTLYKKATRHDFFSRVKPDGVLANITLKGIIPDLIHGAFKNYQVEFIHLMDNFEVWPYNTCFFSIKNSPRVSEPVILGGLAAKLYTPNQEEAFPMVYYSGSNNGMDKNFGPSKPVRVIRKLPGKHSDTVVYDYTDLKIQPGWKFAFNVLESKKSYYVTDEPIFGGTICYIPTKSKHDAEKLKLFVENNIVFREYVKRMKLKGHAFGLRNLKKFNLNQINTGFEIPIEWNICDKDLVCPEILPNDVEINKDRSKSVGEVFTPTSLVNIMLDHVEHYHPDAFRESYTFIDSMCGDGQFLSEILNRKISNGIPIQNAINSIYGIDIVQDNVTECRRRLQQYSNDRDTIENHVICENSFSYTFQDDRFKNLFC